MATKRHRKYTKTRTRYGKYIRMIYNHYHVNDVFDEKECFDRIFRKRKKISYLRWKALLLIMKRNGLIQQH